MSSPNGPWGPQGQDPQGQDPQGGQWGQPAEPQWGQSPQQPAEPQWGQPQQPAQPQWGQPEQPAQPQWGQSPQQPAQPQWGQPQQPAQPQWGPQTGAQPTQQWNQPTGSQPAQGWGGQPTGSQPAQGWSGQPTGSQPAQGWNPQGGAQPGQQWPQYGQPNYPGGQPGGGNWGEPPKKKANKGVIITAVAVVVALLAGLGVYFFAFRDSKTDGKDTPQQAAAQLFADIDNGDLVALADTFDPVEAALVQDLAGDVVEQFKRLGLLTDDATVNSATGAGITIKDITFDDSKAEKPLNDLTIVKLTGGIITITPADTSGDETDLYKRLKDALGNVAADSGMSATAATEPTVINIADVIRDENKGEPIRISTVLRDGAWYPSLFYTIADYAVQENGGSPVTAADEIPAAGKGSPEEAVNAMIQAVIAEDAEQMIALLPPDEMAAVHDYGKKIVDAAGNSTPASGVDVKAEWVTSEVTGGTLVSVKTLTVTAEGETVSITIDKAAGSMTVDDGSGEPQVIDADSISEMIGTGDLSEIHPNMPDFVGRMLKAAMGMGIVTVKASDNLWYVSPTRSFTGVFTTLLGGMEQKDIEMFIELANK